MMGARTQFRATFLIAIFLVSGMFGFMLNPLPAVEESQAAPNPIPTLALQLQPTTLQARVTQSALGTVTFGGNATVDKIQGIERVTVTLTGVVNTGWPVVLSRQTMVYVSPGTQQFQVSVVVPPATSSLLTGNVIVTGSAKAPGLAPIVAAASAVVTVSQFYKLRIEAESPLREVKPGELTYNVVNIYNDGNGQDTFELEIENQKELVNKKQFTVLLASTDVTVQQDEYQPVRVTVKTPEDWTLYLKEMTTIILKVESSEARNRQQIYIKQYPLYIYRKGYYIPGFDPFLAILAIAFIAIIIKRRSDLEDESLGRLMP